MKKGKLFLILCFIIFIVFIITQSLDLASILINGIVLIVMGIFIAAGFGYLFTKKGIAAVDKCRNDLLNLCKIQVLTMSLIF